MGDKDRMTGDQVTAQLTTEGLTDWRPVLGRVVTRFKTGDFVTGLQLTTKVTEAAESANHHPDVDLRYPHVDITLTSHDVSGTTQRDLRLAREISAIAATMGIEAEPGLRQFVELALDTWAEDEVKPFWAALLGAEDREYDVADPSGQIPPLWFQDTDRHDEPRQRFHLDVWVPVDQAQPRIDAALAAGGTLVSDEHAPSFVVLADAQGNRACICTSASRG
ncbi:MAG: 4a-hydroxytetrahydrobiopterin dehydratase [Nocardioides sp.]